MFAQKIQAFSCDGRFNRPRRRPSNDDVSSGACFLPIHQLDGIMKYNNKKNTTVVAAPIYA